MKLEQLAMHWNKWGRSDPLFAILTDPTKRYGRWQTEAFFASGVEEITQLMLELRKLDLPCSRLAALDFGCGVGRLTQALCAWFERADGVDIAESMIEHARNYNRHGERCRYHENVREDLELFPQGTFDLVYSNVVCQHIAPRLSSRYITEFLRVLAPGGVLVFQIPSHQADRPSRRVTHKILLQMKRLIRTICNAVSQTITSRPLFPIMEMNALPRSEVAQIISSCGGTLLEAREDVIAAPGWISYRYFVTR